MRQSQRTSRRSAAPRTLLVVALGFLAASVGAPPPAEARGKRKCSPKSVKKLKLLARDAQDELDRWELAKAKRKINDAKLVSRARGCIQHPVMARVFIVLGVLKSRQRDYQAVKAAFRRALELDHDVQIPKSMRTPKLLRIYKWLKARVKARPRPEPRPEPRPTPRTGKPGKPGTARPVTPRPRPRPKPVEPKQFEHASPKTWKLGRRLVLTVRAPVKLKAAKIQIFYRNKKKAKWKLGLFRKGGPDRWSWTFSLNGVHMYAKKMYYFIVAYNAKGRPLVASGNALQTHLIETRR